MKRNYTKWQSIVLITAIYILSGIAGVALFACLTESCSVLPVVAILCADVLATVIVWAAGLLYENVSVYDPYWSVFPPVAFLLYALYTHLWSLPIVLLLIASWYWGWRLTRNWAITFKGIAHEDWRYSRYRDTLHPMLFHITNFLGLNMVPTLVVFAAMLPGLRLYEISPADSATDILSLSILIAGFIVCLSSATIQLIADKQIHDFRRDNPGKYCNVGLWKHGRHPNYFGEIQFWWGIWLMYVSQCGIDWYVLGPVAMTALFLGISIPMMERRQLQNKPGYAEYKKQTRMLI